MKFSNTIKISCFVLLIIALTSVDGQITRRVDDWLAQLKGQAEIATGFLEEHAQHIIEEALKDEGVQSLLDIGEDMLDRALEASKGCVREAMDNEIARGALDIGGAVAGKALGTSNVVLGDALGEEGTARMVADNTAQVLEASRYILKEMMNDQRVQKAVQAAAGALEAGHGIVNRVTNQSDVEDLSGNPMEGLQASQFDVKDLVRDQEAKELMNIGAGVMRKALKTSQNIVQDMFSDEKIKKVVNLLGKTLVASKKCVEKAEYAGMKKLANLFRIHP